MSESTCQIMLGPVTQEACRIDELIARECQRQAPMLAWGEPDPLEVDLTNETGRRTDFTPLVRGTPPWTGSPSLVEARLFWPQSALHIVAHEGGCAWSRLDEISGRDDVPEGIPALRQAIKVHTLRDLSRFGLAGDEGISVAGLRAIEYRRHGRLIAWRLLLAGKEE